MLVTYTVDVEFDPFISAYLKYNAVSNTVSYDGKEIAGLTRTKFLN